MSEASLSRRRLLVASSAIPLGLSLLGGATGTRSGDDESDVPVHEDFPRQHPERVRDVVLFSHFDLERVRALVEESPALARASWDWGFGDWESALGAASHTGRREIARYLISRGARPDLFTAAMLGQLAVVRAAVEASPGIEATRGPHGITLLEHAQAGGVEATAVVAYLEALPDAHRPPPDPTQASTERRRHLGHYRYGEGDDEVLEVLEREETLAVRRGEQPPRTLHPIAAGVFHPSGVPEVQIRFESGENGRIESLAVEDGSMVVEARRIEAGAPGSD